MINRDFLISIAAENIANITLVRIRNYFSKTGYLFNDNNQVIILTGREEVINAWISANYFENNFNLVSILFNFKIIF